MSRKEWIIVTLIVAAMAIGTLLSRSRDAQQVDSRPTTRRQSTRGARPVEEILAYEQTGGPPSAALVRRFALLLDDITQECAWSRREASDKLLKMHRMLRNDGHEVELLDLTVGLDRGKAGVSTDCHEVLATVGAMLGRE